MYDARITPKIILLNGTSSSGKSTLAKALQATLSEPYLHVCIDTFEDMMPGRCEESGAFTYHAVFDKLLLGMHSSIRELAKTGSNLIVDHVLIEGEEPFFWVSDCLEKMAPFDVLMVGVHCSQEELDRRERERGDRRDGLARWQITRMHKTLVYDLEVDTSVEATGDSVARIVAALAQERQGFRKSNALISG